MSRKAGSVDCRSWILLSITYRFDIGSRLRQLYIEAALSNHIKFIEYASSAYSCPSKSILSDP